VADIDLWPISTLPVADMVFYVADMVVADIDGFQQTEEYRLMQLLFCDVKFHFIWFQLATCF